MSDFQAQLAAAFAAELAEHLAAVRAGLALVEQGGAADLRDMFRRAHSLKGAARAVDQPATEAAAHALEALLADVEQGRRTLDKATIAVARAALDRIEDAAGGDAPKTDAPDVAPAAEVLRVSGTHVERLARSVIGMAEEVRARGTTGRALIGIEAELRAIAAAVKSEDLRRRIARVGSDVRRLQGAAGQAQWALDQALTTLEGDAERIMLLPAHILFDGYERMVRELAAAQGKQVALETAGGEVEADRRVLQALRDPVMHLLRNAVSHGMEMPAVRRRGGKAEVGTVGVSIAAERGSLVVTVFDDGAGLDYARIETEARRAGLTAGGAAPSREALRGLVFEHRFSTAALVDAVSGRGVGLAVVAEAARALHGRVAIEDRAGGGSQSVITVPLKIARQALVMVELGGATFALPANAVGQVLQLAPDALHAAEGGAVALIEGRRIRVVALAPLLAIADAPTAGQHPALLLEDGGAELLLVVDRLIEVRRGIIGDPTAIAADVDLVFGTVILDDGAVALVLSPAEIMARALAGDGIGRIARGAAPEAARQRTILVVDDSVTTRTLERSILEAAGYRVLLSVDGLDGLERLRAGADEIDLVVADVEMPRMDGFGLLQAIRNDPVLANIPVVMMTSRNAPDDIERGLALGANAYVTKQDFDQGGLLGIVGQLA